MTPPIQTIVTRKPGRPRKVDGASSDFPLISPEVVVRHAYGLCDTLRPDEISLEQLAREMGVSATTIRHHLKNRKTLTTALIEVYFHELWASLPPRTDDWKADLDDYLWAYMSMNFAKRGFASYFFEHRFSPKIDPLASPDSKAIYKRVLDILQAAGLDTLNAALAWHLIIHLLLSIAYAESKGQTPADRAQQIDSMMNEDDKDGADRDVIDALRHVDLAMIYGVISNMLTNAIAVKFDYPDERTVDRSREVLRPRAPWMPSAGG